MIERYKCALTVNTSHGRNVIVVHGKTWSRLPNFSQILHKDICINTNHLTQSYWMYSFTGCTVILDVQLYWMYSYTGCIQLYWMYSYTGCTIILNVQLYWMYTVILDVYSYTGCIQLYWMYSYTGCTIILDV